MTIKYSPMAQGVREGEEGRVPRMPTLSKVNVIFFSVGKTPFDDALKITNKKTTFVFRRGAQTSSY